jgi:secreted trypsin-like serine protease
MVCGKRESRLTGIVSWGPKHCGLESVPGIYTHVAAFKSWINEKIKLKPKPKSKPETTDIGISSTPDPDTTTNRSITNNKKIHFIEIVLFLSLMYCLNW